MQGRAARALLSRRALGAWISQGKKTEADTSTCRQEKSLACRAPRAPLSDELVSAARGPASRAAFQRWSGRHRPDRRAGALGTGESAGPAQPRTRALCGRLHGRLSQGFRGAAGTPKPARGRWARLTVSSPRPEPPPGGRGCRVGQYVVDLTSFEQLALPALSDVSVWLLPPGPPSLGWRGGRRPAAAQPLL